MHTRREPGKFSHSLAVGGFSAPVLSLCRYWVNRAVVLGEHNAARGHKRQKDRRLGSARPGVCPFGS